MITVFKILVVSMFRDIQTLFWSIVFPIALLVGLGIYYDNPAYSKQILAGVLCISVIFGALNITAFGVLQQRKRGVYKLLKTTPFRIINFVTALTLARTVISLLVSLITLVTGMIFLEINIEIKELGLVCLLLILGTICFSALGFLVANFSENEGQVNMISNLITMPMIFMSEAFYTLDNSPEWIQKISNFSPFTYFVESINSVISNFELIATPVYILSAFTIGFLFLSIVTFKWDTANHKNVLFKKKRVKSSEIDM